MLIKQRLSSRLTLIAIVLFGFAAIATAQSTATLQGTVTDQKGAVVPGAAVTVRNKATSLERTTQTDSQGNYQVAALPAGTYSVEVKLQGFKTKLADQLPIEVATTAVQNFQLEVGEVSEQVVVTSQAAMIESATTSVGTVINQKTVQEIPLNGRHMLELGLLIPGSVTTPANGFLTTPIRGQGQLQINTGGAREDTVNFQINGINLNDMVQNQVTFQPTINTVQEFKIDNSTFSAEYGRNSGAIINVATRSGGNKFHGELFDFVRNDRLDARNFFDRCTPGVTPNCTALGKNGPFKRNEYGFNIGGPIYLPRFGEGGPSVYSGKNKSFFFFSFEGLRQRQGLTINTLVLTDAQRASATDPSVIKLLKVIPQANSAGGTRFAGSAPAPVNLNQWTLDMSHQFSAKDQLHGYYAKQTDLRQEGLSGTNLPGFGDQRQGIRQILTLNETHTFSPTVVNELRVGFNRIHITFFPNGKLNPPDFGINNGITDSRGLPSISVTGSFQIGGPGGEPQGRADTLYAVSDTLSWLRGKHSLKIGGEARRFFNNNFTSDTGSFNFASPADFLIGKVTRFTQQTGDVTSAIKVGNLGLYIQDNYKWRPNVTFELGFRYDWNTTPTERFNRFSVFDPATVSLIRENAGIGSIYHNNAKNFQPRVGFSWDPFKDGKTSVRGAYAILTDQPVVISLATNPPFAINVISTAAGLTFANANTLASPVSGAISPASVERNFHNAYVQSWNLNAQREIRPGLSVMLGYFGSKGTHLRISRNINQPIAALVSATNPKGLPFPKLSANSPILPGNALNIITEIDSAGNSSYNALWASVNKRLSRGFQMSASYAWSKSIDWNSRNGGTFVQDSYNLRGDRGLSDFDARQRFSINWIYDLPFHGNKFFEGWELTGITQSQSGNPIVILAGSGFVNLTGTATLRPDLVGPVQVLRDPNNWFTAAAFAAPGTTANSHFGSLGRGVVIGPTFNNTDFSVIKNTRISENVRVQFRAEIFDIFNHANFGQPGPGGGTATRLGTATFTQFNDTRLPTGDAGSSRQVQFALKLLF